MTDDFKARHLEIKKERMDGELLMARGRSNKKSWKGKEEFQDFPLNKGEARKCFLFHKKGQFKKYCPLNKSKKASSNKHATKTSATNVTGCTYHMTSNWDLLIDFKKMMGEKSYWAITIPLMSREVDQVMLLILTTRVLKVTKGSLVKLKGTLRNGLYVLEGAVSGKSLGVSNDQSPLVSLVEATEQSEFVGVKSQQQMTLIDEGVFSDSIVFDSKKQWNNATGAELFSLQKN
ncbi:Retrovirus-related Pol polyprotein from transposon TNT 1-94 [Cucumis melo var. makuwa]|uniref:Retrovirus-related Pol polyprotein from transposon TNT 1-94 n=1 Tax=Cucumis melo var. makuwa TaxID=1194695 RepID=A0A5D3C503_CUCMM|nr:Retrovirus-related Pol polyprotein from transposon TNT 1-94 [Cucumis melo var. makuwa]TYK06465.1 Retrovirus-related Pol polyprotein from transposon TNT 1-94 [Cucumis melo var. makuwa]